MLELIKITKTFKHCTALEAVSLNVAAGEIHGLVGLNGSGKSTLLNILFGSRTVAATGGYLGEIRLDNTVCRFRSPGEAIAAGIGMVHQEFALIPEMSVAENVRLTREVTFSLSDKLFSKNFSLVDTRRTRLEADQALQAVGLQLDQTQKAGHLSMNIKQFVEIAREISKKQLKLLLLDEPTAVLNNKDAGRLADVLRSLADRGTAIIFVSHRLDEIVAVCDRLTVLRDGRSIGSYKTAECDAMSITRLMVRDDVAKVQKLVRTITTRPILSVRHFSVNMPGEEIRHLDLDIQTGEILGIASLSGHGKAALGAGIMGLQPFQGDLYLHGVSRRSVTCAEMIREGLFLLSDERLRHGLLMHQSIMDNIVFSAIQNKGRFLQNRLPGWAKIRDKKAIRTFAEQCIADLAIHCVDLGQKVSELSGGNQQKVCIAHALALEPELLFVCEPTRGIDIAAKERILDLFITANRTRGTTIVIASSELDELKRISDRIAVLYKGKLLAILAPTASDSQFANALSGEESLL